MSIVGPVMKWVLILIAAIMAFGLGTSMAQKPSDISVILGFLIMALSVVVPIGLAIDAFRKSQISF